MYDVSAWIQLTGCDKLFRSSLQARDGTICLPGSSHAETALSSSSDALISLDLGIIQALVKVAWRFIDESTARYFYNLGRSLVRLCGAEECSRNTDNGKGEDDGKVFHVVVLKKVLS